jgi:hypothetical protein
MGPAGLPADEVRVLLTDGQARSAVRGNSLLGGVRAGGGHAHIRTTVYKLAKLFSGLPYSTSEALLPFVPLDAGVQVPVAGSQRRGS